MKTDNFVSVAEYLAGSGRAKFELIDKLLRGDLSVLCFVHNLPVDHTAPVYKDGESVLWGTPRVSSITGFVKISELTAISILKSGARQPIGAFALTNLSRYVKRKVDSLRSTAFKSKLTVENLVIHVSEETIQLANEEGLTEDLLKKAIAEATVNLETGTRHSSRETTMYFRHQVYEFLSEVEYEVATISEMHATERERYGEEVLAGEIIGKYFSDREWISLAGSGGGTVLSRPLPRVAVKKAPYQIDLEDLVVVSDIEAFYAFGGDGSQQSDESFSRNFEKERQEDSGSHIDVVYLVKEQFWSSYDVDDISTMPKRDEIISWLVQEGLTSSTAQAKAIELVARGDRSPPTGRPRKNS